jgi:hypothetical protein
MTAWLWLGLGLCSLALGAVALAVYGERRWARALQAMHQGLESGRAEGAKGGALRPTRYDESELSGLPAPVQRYFRAALTPGQALVTAVKIDMAGRFNLSATGEQWRPFTSAQWVTVHRPGFLWDAKIAAFPGVALRAVDSYIAGLGLLRAAAQGWFTLAEVRGEGDIARGEFLRWFAEAPWYPTVLLPSQGVKWKAVSEHSASATLVDGPLSLTLLFRFNDVGLIGSFRAEARGSMAGQKMVMAPWEGNWSNYQTRNGMQIPFTGEVAWMRLEGRRSYFVGTVKALAFEFSR